jgi:hypothetical protein
LGLVSCCEGLERLHVPWGVFRSLPPTCPTFKRLTHLDLADGHRGGTVDVTSPVWDRVASGLLPALVHLSFIVRQGPAWNPAGDGGCQLAHALEGLAGMLTHLTLHFVRNQREPPVAVCQRLGAAIGKLGRLRFLSLHLSQDGRVYQAMGRGLAASGGCPPLLELHLRGVERNMDCLVYEPSLIVPSVRRLHITGDWSQELAQLMCCGLVRLGYRHRLEFEVLDPSRRRNFDPACMRPILRLGGINFVARVPK